MLFRQRICAASHLQIMPLCDKIISGRNGLQQKGGISMSDTVIHFETKRDHLTIRGTVFQRTDSTPLHTVIISHGFIGTEKDVRNYALALSHSRCRVYTYDFCGGSINSSSDGATTDMTVFTEVEDLLAVINFARADAGTEKVTLLGFSQGGFVSALCASRHPQLVQKLILVYPALCIPDDARRGKMILARFRPGHVPETFRCGPMLLGGNYARCVQNIDPFKEISGYAGPVLILHGTKDNLVPLRYSEQAIETYRRAGRVPVRERDCELIALEGAGHGFDEENDNKAIAMIREFLFRSDPIAGKRLIRKTKPPVDLDNAQSLLDNFQPKDEYSLDDRFVIRDGKTHPFALIVPGGAYFMVCSFIEGVPYAKALNKMGISAFILYYRTAENAKFPNPQDDLAHAVREILNHAADYHVDPENYSVWGSSAGGHLAASFGTNTMGYLHYELPKPGAIVLAYPVITMDLSITHFDTHDYLIGADADRETEENTSIEQQVTDAFPKTFVWAGDIDTCVPAENSRRLALALGEAGVPCVLEICRSTEHGVGPGTGTAAEGWIERAVEFWRE